MTSATDDSIKQQYPLAMDDLPDEQKAIGAQEPIATPKHTVTPAKVPANAPTRPIPEPVVNAESDPLEEFLSSLSPAGNAEVRKYSNIPDSELEIPTEKRAAAILTAFHKQHTTVPAGQRNHTLFVLSCTLRRCGYEEKDILAELWKFSRDHCQPPHNQNNRSDVDELTQLAWRAARHVRPGFPANNPEPTRVEEAGPSDGLTELAAAERFVEKIPGGYLFNITTRKWHVWTGKVWQIDERNLVKNRCRTFVKSLYGDLGDIGGKRGRVEYLGDVEKLNTRRGIENIISLAAIQLTKRSEDFDANPHVLNFQNGTIEFAPTGMTFREHRKEDLCSFIGGCEYRPDEPVPEIWINHTHKIASEDPDLEKTIQTVLGYSLDGGNPLEKLVFTYGPGRNGKSVTLRTICKITGRYAVATSPNTLMESGNKTTSPERLKLWHARLIVAQESNSQPDDHHHKDTTVLDTCFLKAASGKDVISARGLYSNTVEEFTITGLVILSTNALPIVTDRSVAFWDRLIPLPFDHYFGPDERDPLVEEKFNAVLPGILNWLIQGWENYRKTGTIKLCETVKTALNEYRDSGDEYAGFIHDCIEDCKGADVRGTALYDEYASYTKSRYGTAKNSTLFGRDMDSRFSKKRTNTGIVYTNIKLKTGQMQVAK